MIVILNNGIKIKVSQNVADTILKNIGRPDGAKSWQMFSADDTTVAVHLFQLSQVSAITDEKNIIK